MTPVARNISRSTRPAFVIRRLMLQNRAATACVARVADTFYFDRYALTVLAGVH